jgi:hypothetical protein
MRHTPRHAAVALSSRRLQVVAMVMAATLALVVTSLVSQSRSQPAQAMAKIKCKQTTGTGRFDPIVHHDETPPVGHNHQFFGNNAWLSLPNPNAANLSDLQGKGTNCANPKDTAGYWVPVLQNKTTKAPVAVQAFTAYYRSFDFKEFGQGQPLPPDTRLVAEKHNWSCGQYMSVKPVPYIPDCSGATGQPGSTLTAHIDFPSCWNGVKPNHPASQVGDTTDNKNFAYESGGACPSGFPIKVVALRETISYQYTGHGTDLELSSDAEHGTTDGQSLHADFFNAWDTAGMASMVKNCVSGTGTPTAAECG